MKKALITGITGMDGSHLADFLLEKGYEVHGVVRRISAMNRERIEHLQGKLAIHQADLSDQASLTDVIARVLPDEVYNLAAMSSVPVSWKVALYTGDVTGLGAARVFEAVRQVRPKARVYQASSSEQFGKVQESPQNEETRFYPRSPYAAAKCYAHHIAVNYRESYGLHISCGICFNHESERRGIEFVTRKITDGVARIKLGLASELRLGNLNAKRDWGYAPDYVRAMWLMLQEDEPDDYVIATGVTHTVKEFVQEAFAAAAIRGSSLLEDFVVVDKEFHRPAEVDTLCGDARKARERLGWVPQVGFHEVVIRMMHADLIRLQR
jgi:GDPmannose 4,6-dehydratase